MMLNKHAAYISVPHTDDALADIRRAQVACIKCITLNYEPVCPLLLLPVLPGSEHQVDREAVIQAGMGLIPSCALLFQYGDIIGEEMGAEQLYAKSLGKPCNLINPISANQVNAPLLMEDCEEYGYYIRAYKPNSEWGGLLYEREPICLKTRQDAQQFLSSLASIRLNLKSQTTFAIVKLMKKQLILFRGVSLNEIRQEESKPSVPHFIYSVTDKQQAVDPNGIMAGVLKMHLDNYDRDIWLTVTNEFINITSKEPSEAGHLQDCKTLANYTIGTYYLDVGNETIGVWQPILDEAVDYFITERAANGKSTEVLPCWLPMRIRAKIGDDEYRYIARNCESVTVDGHRLLLDLRTSEERFGILDASGSWCKNEDGQILTFKTQVRAEDYIERMLADYLENYTIKPWPSEYEI